MIAAVLAPLIYLAIAITLIVSQNVPSSGDTADNAGGLDFSRVKSPDSDQFPPFEHFVSRDGAEMPFRRYASAAEGSPALVLLHGSGWHGMQFHTLATQLSTAGVADVIVPDLRGHGLKPQRRGDVDHIGQLEEDLADLIGHLKGQNSDQRVIVGGHSSGGGLAVRFAGGDYGNMADGWILLAPFLKYDAPTTRPDSGGWAQPLVRRIIGLTMLNQIGVRTFNNLDVIWFTFPNSVLDGPLGNTATRSYTYRMNVSFAPRDEFEADLAAIHRPLLVVAGSNDEAFIADQYEPAISAQTKSGAYAIVEGETHLGIVDSQKAADRIIEWFAELGD